MIVTYTEEGWSIILQRSHGLLAGQICGHWKRSKQPERWVETLIATAEHDDVSNELNSSDLLTQSGGPKNFKANKFNKEECDHLLARAIEKGLYVALLIARHVTFLYGKEPSAKTYFAALKKREKEWIRQTKTTSEEIAASYELVEFCDAMSLLICQDLIQPEERKIEISTGPGGAHYELWKRDDQHLIVSPWPFEEDSFTANYETRSIAQLAFKNDTEFKEILESSEVTLMSLKISKD
ncbi:DUF3891 family protein [Dyadobacter arcticus]|uniref:DUF3891 family protein n=1 Tax=Dyadobacter arcticus TaxID=1078754 RepID=A0ABX0UN73_9BACT|nr:DUF3891 family protein [Dyadobacter arcticus]NIJ54443.1 hypothetical protein [Dyadobacter arcticus]